MAITPTKKYIDINGLGLYHEESAPEMTYAEWQALPDSKLTDGREYHITDLSIAGVAINDVGTPSTDTVWSSSKTAQEISQAGGAQIDDTTTASNKVWSSQKVSTELNGKANSSDVNNKHKTTTKTVDTSSWTADTTSQSGVTLYKKQISLNHVYVDCPNVDIGASGVLPTTAQQEAYNLIQYVTVDSAVPCLYLYASAIPSTSFYINVVGVD